MPEAPAHKVRASAPLRVLLAGDGSDVALFAGEHGGGGVAAALSLSAQVEVRLGGRTIRLRGEDPDDRVTLESPAGIVYDGRLDRPKAALNMLPVTGGVEILSWAEASRDTGLGRRAALDVALLAALCECRREPYAAADVAELAFQLEAVELKRYAGRQDPWIATFGGVRAFAFAADMVEHRPLAMEAAAIADLSAHLLLAHAPRPFGSDRADWRLWERYATGDAALAAALAAARDTVAPMTAALEAGEWRRVGELFDDTARQWSALDPLWSAPPIRAAVAAARDAGAWGIKPAGPRSSASLLVAGPRERRDAITAALKGQGWVVLAVTLAQQGLEVWLESLEG